MRVIGEACVVSSYFKAWNMAVIASAPRRLHQEYDRALGPDESGKAREFRRQERICNIEVRRTKTNKNKIGRK
jgi:hypothetical protein